MPSVLHESIIDCFRARPQLAAELLNLTGLLDAAEVEETQERSPDLSRPRPPEFHADLVLLVRTRAERLIVAIEVQLGLDADKRFTWPAYCAILRAHHRCSAVILVIALEPSVAAWAEDPIPIGPGNVFRPLVIGPGRIPAVTDPDRARRSPELALLSVLAHGHGPAAPEVAIAALTSALGLDAVREKAYIDLILNAVQPALRARLEAFMQEPWVPQSDFLKRIHGEAREEGREEGLEQGLSGQRALLRRVLVRRFGPLPADLEQRLSQAQPDQLGDWGEDFAAGLSLDEIFRRAH